MQVALDSFRQNLNRARALGGVFAALQSATTPALDLTDLLRAEIVLAVSAFDHFIHEITRLACLETFAGARSPTAAYLRFEVTLETLGALLTNPEDPGPFDQELRQRHSWLSFQRPDKVADALRMVSAIALWDEVAAKLGMPAGDVKARVNAIIDRRNQIAHEADLDPTDPMLQTKWPISPTDAEATVEFLDRVGIAVFDVIA